METRPIPNPGAGEVLIRVKDSGSAAPSCSPDRAIHPTYGFDACSVSKRSARLRRLTVNRQLSPHTFSATVIIKADASDLTYERIAGASFC
jgi:hypothetical protein